MSLLALVNYTAQHSIPIVVNSLSNMYANAYRLPEIKVINQPFTYTTFQEGILYIERTEIYAKIDSFTFISFVPFSV